MIDRSRIPSPRELAAFAVAAPTLLALAGTLRWHAGSPRTAAALWAVAAAIALPALASTAWRLRLYRGWMLAASPVAWIVSRVALAAIWFVVATPTALVLRALGRDPLQRAIDRSAPTYWRPREAVRDRARYLRQF